MVDLLVAMAKAAVQSSRNKVIFEPYPSVVDPKDKSKLAFTPDVRLLGFLKFSLCRVESAFFAECF